MGHTQVCSAHTGSMHNLGPVTGQHIDII